MKIDKRPYPSKKQLKKERCGCRKSGGELKGSVEKGNHLRNREGCSRTAGGKKAKKEGRKGGRKKREHGVGKQLATSERI